MAWNNSKTETLQQSEKTKLSKRVALVSFAIVSALVGIGIYVFCIFAVDKEEKRQIGPRVRKIAEATSTYQGAKAKTDVQDPKTNRIYKLKDGRPSVPLSKMTLAERRAWLDAARVERSLRHGWTNEYGEARIPKTLFKSSTEQALSRIFMTKLGNPPPRIPNIGKIDGKNLESILNRMSEAQEGDSEYVKNVRATLNAAKNELKNFVADGGSVNQFLEYYQGELANCYAMRQEAQNSFREMLKSSADPESLRQFYDKANAILESKGIQPIIAGPKVMEAMGYQLINTKEN